MLTDRADALKIRPGRAARGPRRPCRRGAGRTRRAGYRARLAELSAELDEAERWNDPERAARVRAERDFVARELGAALGRGGRPRTLVNDAERARISVTRALRAAIDRIGRVDASAGAHFDVAVRTGTVCSHHSERTEPATPG